MSRRVKSPLVDIAIRTYGFPRSGGTLVFNLIKSMFDVFMQTNQASAKIARQTHSFFNRRHGKDIAVATHRDFRDCLLSMWRVESANMDTPKRDEIVGLDNSDLIEYAEYLKKQFGFLNKFETDWQKENIIFLKYDDFYRNYDVVFDAIIDKVKSVYEIDLKLNEDQRDNIKEQWSVKKVREFQKRYKSFHEFDRTNHIHGFHVATGETGIWKKYLKKEDRDKLTKMYKDQLLKWGYEL